MKCYLICFFVFTFVLGFSQDKTFDLNIDSKIDIKADKFIGFDGFKNYYFVNNNVLIKYYLGETMQYQNLALGNITKVDITNPLKILVFYENFNTIQLLDNQLNEITKINFNEIDSPILVKYAGISGQNKIWTFDANSQQIGLYDYVNASYKAVGNPLTKSIVLYFTDFNSFFWIDTESNWYVTNLYGNTVLLDKADKMDAIQIISNNNILFADGMQLVVKNRISKNRINLEIVEKTFINYYYKDQILSIFTSEGITNYKILIP